MIPNEKKSNLSDEALARLAANGNAAAFDEIYSRHRSFVYNVAVRMTGNRLAIFSVEGGPHAPLTQAQVPSADYPSLERAGAHVRSSDEPQRCARGIPRDERA